MTVFFIKCYRSSKKSSFSLRLDASFPIAKLAAFTISLLIWRAFAGQIETQRMQEIQLPFFEGKSFWSIAPTGHFLSHKPHFVQPPFTLGTRDAEPSFT